MVLKTGADLFQIQVVHVVHPGHTVGVAHGNTGHGPVFSIHVQGAAHHRAIAQAPAGDLLRQKARLAHLHLPPAVPLPAQQLYAVVRVNVQHFFFAAVVAQPLGHTANAVAAHNPPASVRVEHLHAGIRTGGNGRADANHAIRPDGQVPTGQPSCQFWNIIPQAAALVQINIIVAAAMHFCKVKFHGVPLSLSLSFHKPPGPKREVRRGAGKGNFSI